MSVQEFRFWARGLQFSHVHNLHRRSLTWVIGFKERLVCTVDRERLNLKRMSAVIEESKV